jgi:hypothetical protein
MNDYRLPLISGRSSLSPLSPKSQCHLFVNTPRFNTRVATCLEAFDRTSNLHHMESIQSNWQLALVAFKAAFLLMDDQ